MIGKEIRLHGDVTQRNDLLVSVQSHKILLAITISIQQTQPYQFVPVYKRRNSFETKHILSYRKKSKAKTSLIIILPQRSLLCVHIFQVHLYSHSIKFIVGRRRFVQVSHLTGDVRWCAHNWLHIPCFLSCLFTFRLDGAWCGSWILTCSWS